MHEALMRASAHPLAFWGRMFVAVVALSQCFAGRGGQPRLLILAAMGFPLGLLLVDPSFRSRCLISVIRLWRDLSRPAPEWRRWFAGFAFVGAPAAVLYVFHPFYHIDSGDTWAVIPTAASVVHEGNAEVSEYVGLAPTDYYQKDPYFQGLPYSVMRVPVGVYSRYPAGMTILAVPVVAVASISGADFEQRKTIDNLDRWTAACVAVFLVMLFFRVALRLAPPSAALFTTWLLAIGSGVYTTVAQSMWQHGGVAIGMLLLINVELDERARRCWWGLAIQAFAVGLMYSCRLTSGLMAASFGVWVLTRSPTRGVQFGLVSVIGVLPWALFYYTVYGSPLGPSQSQMVASGWRWDSLEPLAGVLFSPARGLFVYQPWVVLSIVGLLWNSIPDTRYPIPGINWMCAVAAGLQIILVASWACWWGGSCWGSRLLTEAIPLLALLALGPVTVMMRSRVGRVALFALLILSLLPHLGGIWRAMLGANWKNLEESTMWNMPNWSAL